MKRSLLLLVIWLTPALGQKNELGLTLGSFTGTRDIATLYATPGLRLKLLPKAKISPWLAVGGGYAAYQQSTTLISGAPNPAIRNLNHGVFDFGGGMDTPLWRLMGLRAEVRDFYSGNPAHNAPLSGSGQHNVLASGRIVRRFGK